MREGARKEYFFKRKHELKRGNKANAQEKYIQGKTWA